MKMPGPDHSITIAPHPGRVRVMFNGRAVADTARAFALHETNYPPVLYIPRDDADMALLERSTHHTYCPYKGDASYYTIRVGNRVAAVARMKQSEIRGCFVAREKPGLRGACHRAGHFGPDPLAPSGLRLLIFLILTPDQTQPLRGSLMLTQCFQRLCR